MKKITILGSTGSIGISTLSVIYENPHLFSVIALVAKKNIKLMLKQCYLFRPKYVVMLYKKIADELSYQIKNTNLKIKVLFGEKSICRVSSLENVDIVVSAIVGSAGLVPTIAAIDSKKTILLANKESLVICGKLFMERIKKSKAKILPIDSEHNAIFQSLPTKIQENLSKANLKKIGVDNIILTGSGGAVRKLSLSELKYITPKQVCNHPNWSMGKKISIDSSTMINKGFEYIETYWLFNLKNIKINIVIHPQSIIHSMVYYIDGSLITQLSIPNMKIPISYALSWPKRLKSSLNKINFYDLKKLTFIKPDFLKYPCLKLALEAHKAGGSAPIILNASNEISVNAFLNKKICFIDIAKVNSEMLNKFSFIKKPVNIKNVIDIDKEIRFATTTFISHIY